MRRKLTLFTRARFHFVATILSTLFLAIAGCGDGKLACYPVKGSVQVDGKPAEGAIVIFCPVNGDDPEFMRQRPFARSDAQGNYELRTFETGDGAPAGEYKVMVRWTTPPVGQVVDRGADPRAGGMEDRLRNRYADPHKSGLSYTVVAEPNQVPGFQLTTR